MYNTHNSLIYFLAVSRLFLTNHIIYFPLNSPQSFLGTHPMTKVLICATITLNVALIYLGINISPVH